MLDGKNACKSNWTGEICDCCGSITVTDAIKYLLTSGTSYSGTDWKYAWPHKFYICPPNPEADKVVEIGREYAVKAGDPNTQSDGFGLYKSITGKRSLLHYKFYSTHLLDATDEELKQYSELSVKYFGILWSKDENGLKYEAPHKNFQKFGIVN